MYRGHDVYIRKEDYENAEEIIKKYYESGGIDDHSYTTLMVRGGYLIKYRIHPYIYEDFETMIREFETSGIQIF